MGGHVAWVVTWVVTWVTVYMAFTAFMAFTAYSWYSWHSGTTRWMPGPLSHRTPTAIFGNHLGTTLVHFSCILSSFSFAFPCIPASFPFAFEQLASKCLLGGSGGNGGGVVPTSIGEHGSALAVRVM